jgi:hypothetical protein
MKTKSTPEDSNQITVNGLTFKTGGNIVFSDTDDSAYFLAEGSQLDKMEGLLEHGMQMLLKKIKK